MVKTPSRGRPANPYSKRVSYWEPGATWDWLGERETDIASAPKPGSITTKDILWHASFLLYQLEVPVLRRVLEAILVHDHGFEPKSVTAALNRLHSVEYLGHRAFRSIKTFEAEQNHIYSMDRKPTIGEMNALGRLYSIRNKALDKETLKTAGERFVRIMILATKEYEAVTQEQLLGKVKIGGKHALDLKATGTTTGTQYGISVKNERAWLHAGSRAIKDVYTKAKAHGVQPWLVVAFATPEAKQRCERDGIRLTVLEHRIAPHTTADGKNAKSLIRKIRPIIGPEPFEFIGTRTVPLNKPHQRANLKRFLDT